MAVSVARHYVMLAGEGKAEALAAALEALAQAVRALPGCLSVEGLVDVDQAERFIFIERWESLEAHKSAGALLPKALMAPVMASLAQKPEGSYLKPLAGVSPGEGAP
jgi:quinol monooxygenase YgiN